MPAEFPKKVFHGGKTYTSADAEKIINVSASLNPFAPEIPVEFSHADISEYPDDSYTELKEKSAVYLTAQQKKSVWETARRN